MKNRQIRIAGKTWQLPADRRWRIALGIALMVGGLLGFLPILGFWMIPLGFVIISYDIAMARRARRKTVVWWKRKNGARRNGGNGDRMPAAGGDPAASDKHAQRPE